MNLKNLKESILHYFEISIILYITLSHTYKILCEDLNVSTDIENIDICDLLDKNAEMLINQYNNRSTENFELYYNHKNN